MKSIILCEGKTDAILISYFLKHFGWKYKKESKDFAYDKNNEVLNEVIKKIKIISNFPDMYKKIIIFCDNDLAENTEETINLFKSWLTNSDINLSNQELTLGQWLKGYVNLTKSPPENYEIDILFIVLPPNSPGNLEVFLLQSLANQSDIDQELVEKTKELIDNIPKEPYLLKKRLEDKAQLGCVLSIISPDWVFSTINERLISIQWETITQVEQVYQMLAQL